MKTMKRFLTATAVAIFAAFGSASICSAQPMIGGNNYNVPQCSLFSDVSQFLTLEQKQADSINKQCLLFEYDQREFADQVDTIDQKISTAMDDPSQSPAAIGNMVAQLVSQRVMLRRQMDNEIQANNKTLLNLLTPTQQGKLNALQAALQSAQNTTNLYWDAVGANLIIPPQNQPVGPPQILPGVSQSAMAMSVNSMIDAAVARAHIRRLNAEAETARQARTVPQRQQ
jgi:hypothetical protein